MLSLFDKLDHFKAVERNVEHNETVQLTFVFTGASQDEDLNDDDDDDDERDEKKKKMAKVTKKNAVV